MDLITLIKALAQLEVIPYLFFYKPILIRYLQYARDKVKHRTAYVRLQNNAFAVLKT